MVFRLRLLAGRGCELCQSSMVSAQRRAGVVCAHPLLRMTTARDQDLSLHPSDRDLSLRPTDQGQSAGTPAAGNPVSAGGRAWGIRRLYLSDHF